MRAGARSLQLGDIEARIVQAMRIDDRVDPRSVQFLLRLYATTGRDELAEPAGLSLAAALRDYAGATSAVEQAAWLELFVDARVLADDGRLVHAIGILSAGLRAAWNGQPVAVAAAAIDACLGAARFDEHRALAQPAIDQLEQLVRVAYKPGSGAGTLADQIAIAGALLAAYRLSGRLPYPMLAEELVAAARPLMENEYDFACACHMVRVLCSLAALHGDESYRRAAVIAPSSDYRLEAEAILERAAADAERRGAAAAIYGLALLELESSHFDAND
jgi:hypothetical protein